MALAVTVFSFLLATLALVPLLDSEAFLRSVPDAERADIARTHGNCGLRANVAYGVVQGTLLVILYDIKGVTSYAWAYFAAFGCSLSAWAVLPPSWNYFRGLTWKRTPYDRLSIVADYSKERPGRAIDFDVFLSYKSDDVTTVRRIADRLVASGYVPWFNEYVVLLDGYESFDVAIDHGVARCRFGVLVTNARYAASAWCRRELDGLLARCRSDSLDRPHPNHVFVLQCKAPDEPLPLPDALRETLAAAPTRTFDGPPFDVDEMLDFLASLTGLRIRPPIGNGAASGMPTAIRGHFEGVSFDISLNGWQSMTPEEGLNPFGDLVSPLYSRRIDGFRLDCRVIIGPCDPTMLQAQRAIQDSVDERDIFDQTRAFARSWLVRAKGRCRGVHLFRLYGYTHLVLTYWILSHWERRYCVILPHPQSGQNIEFAFTFAFLGPFPEYCARIGAMDTVVESLQWPVRPDSNAGGQIG